MRQVAVFSDLSFANRLSQGSFWSQHSFCFYFSAAVCGKVIGSPVYVCLYANTHNVFPPPQPAGSCVDSGWLKCRSKRRPQTLKPALSLTPLWLPHTKLHPLHLSPAFSPLLTASLACVLALSYFPKSPFQSSCQKAHSSKPLPRLNASVASQISSTARSCKNCPQHVDSYLFAENFCAHFFPRCFWVSF